MGLVGHSALAERLGRNQRFRSAGSLAAAGLMGVVGYALSNHFIFFASALLVIPAVVALARVRAAVVHLGPSVGGADHHTATPPPRHRPATPRENRPLMTFHPFLFPFQAPNSTCPTVIR